MTLVCAKRHIVAVGILLLLGLVKATDDTPRPYRFLLLGDHGQSLGATFRQRYGKTLNELVAEAEVVAPGCVVAPPRLEQARHIPLELTPRALLRAVLGDELACPVERIHDPSQAARAITAPSLLPQETISRPRRSQPLANQVL